jgi:hypothetical protein
MASYGDKYRDKLARIKVKESAKIARAKKAAEKKAAEDKDKSKTSK